MFALFWPQMVFDTRRLPFPDPRSLIAAKWEMSMQGLSPAPRSLL